MGGELSFKVSIAPIVVADETELKRQVNDLAELVSRQNRYLMQRLGPAIIPPLYDTRLTYRDDPWGPGAQHFPNALECLQAGVVNCRGAVPYRLAQLRLAHPDQHFAVHSYVRRTNAGLLIHLQILMPHGPIEDPSRFLRRSV